MQDTLVKVENVSKIFCRDLKKSLWYGLKDLRRELSGHSRNRNDDLRSDEFWAVKDVSFELKRGECLGLIGRNGAGKTTLLRMLNGLIKPDQGRIEMRGRVGALIALGAGFNPILTGRENIYVNAAVLGLSKKETDAKFEEIVEFAELGDFIDAPVQSYSSGMAVRLGFAISTALVPDILILDEVLAVGDAAFRNKCYRKIISMKHNSSVIFVSHNMEQIGRVCEKTILLEKGSTVFIGDTASGISTYNHTVNIDLIDDTGFLSISEPIDIFHIYLDKEEIGCGDNLKISIHVTSNSTCGPFIFRLWFYNSAGHYAAEIIINSNNDLDTTICESVNWLIDVPELNLRQGRYYLSFHLIDSDGDMIVWSHKQLKLTVIGKNYGFVADYQVKANFFRQ